MPQKGPGIFTNTTAEEQTNSVPRLSCHTLKIQVPGGSSKEQSPNSTHAPGITKLRGFQTPRASHGYTARSIPKGYAHQTNARYLKQGTLSPSLSNP